MTRRRLRFYMAKIMQDTSQLSALLNHCAQRRPEAMDALYRATSPNLFALALYLLRRRDLAEDALQDCYISIWNHATDYDPTQSQPMTWMLRIVRNRCLDILRRPDIEVPDPDGTLLAAWEDEAPSPQFRLQRMQTVHRLSHCIGQLIPAQRMAIVLGFFDGMSHREIAGRLDAPLGTVKTWTRRGLMQLRRCLR